MLSFLSWYLVVTLLGWLAFPLAYRLFPALADRGYGLSRALGLLVWSYLFWMMASLGMVQNDLPGLLLALVLLAAVSAAALIFRARGEKPALDFRPLLDWLKSNRRMVVTVEVLFFAAFAFLTFVRASVPELVGTEKPMEMAFINAIIHSPTFPPHDPWLSGYAISYYYFGYVMTAMLAEITGVLGPVAFNLMIALVFALSAVGAYAVLFDLLAAWRGRKPQGKKAARAGDGVRALTGLPLLGPFFLLIVSNFEGFLELLHSGGFLWKFNPDGSATSTFWSWLGILDLDQAPPRPVAWIPDRNWWWWRASRVIQDLDLTGKVIGRSEVIDEFPFFSYLLGDLHPHVLAMPFGLLAVALALNIFLGAWKGETKLFGLRIPIQPEGLLFSGLALGGLAFLNTWDILVGFALFAGAFLLVRAQASGWSWRRLKEIVLLCVPIGVLAFVLYLPFYVGFSSQASGILPNPANPTRGIQLWVMFGPLFIPVIAFLVYLWRGEDRPRDWRTGLGLAAALGLLLWVFMWLLAYAIEVGAPDLANNFISSVGGSGLGNFFAVTTQRRLSYFGTWLTLLALIGAALAFLIPLGRGREEAADVPDGEPGTDPPDGRTSAPAFIAFLVLLASLLVLAPDYVYLRDQFGWRINTVFKFYYQAWLMLSLSAAFGVAVLVQSLRGAVRWVFGTVLALVLAMALAYPVMGLSSRTQGFKLTAFQQALKAARESEEKSPALAAARVWSLDGSAYFSQIYPDDMKAAAWLRTAPPGVIVEVVGGGYSDEYNLMSTYSGLPTVLNGPDHEGQWRGGGFEQGSRESDIQLLYETRSWEDAQAVLDRYDIRYVVVGTVERQAYHVYEDKFQQNLVQVFNSGQVTIYAVPTRVGP